MKRFILCISLIFLLFSPLLLAAQSGSDPSDPWCSPFGTRADGTPCPIDSYLYLLLGIGILYGIKKVKESRKSSSN